MMQYALIFVLPAVVLPSQSLECYARLKVSCTAHDHSYVDTCSGMMVDNRGVETQRCSSPQDKCVASRNRFSFEDKFSGQHMDVSCSTTNISGCLDIDDLRAMDPLFFSGGYTFDTYDVCACDTDRCITRGQIEEYERELFQAPRAPRGSCPGSPRPAVAIIFLLVVTFFFKQ